MANDLGDAFRAITSLFQSNQIVFVGDTNHNAAQLRNFLQFSLPEAKKAGVTDLFLERDRVHQRFVDAFFAARTPAAEAKAARDIQDVLGGGDFEQIKILYECKRAGIRVHYMDVGPANKAEEEAKITVFKLKFDI